MIVLLLLVNLITVLFVLYLSAQHVGERKFCRGIIYAWLIYIHAYVFITNSNVPGITLTALVYYLAIMDLKSSREDSGA